jgi:hypothetical protein
VSEEKRDAPNRPTRRKLLVGGALLLVGSAVALVRTRGYDVPADRKLVALSPWQFLVVQALARRIAARDKDDAPTADDVDVAGFIDRYVAEMPAPLRRDLGRMFGYIEHVAPVASGHGSRFTRLADEAQDDVLRGIESSASDLLRGGFDGVKSLVFMGYYRDARTWKILGYEGPLVNRPAGGWTR